MKKLLRRRSRLSRVLLRLQRIEMPIYTTTATFRVTAQPDDPGTISVYGGSGSGDDPGENENGESE